MSIPDIISGWYRNHRRDLPWRRTRNPYAIWISEVILQQTRVEQGLPYYQRFMEIFPDVASLANADQQEVLRMWQGLGYYSRARNLHAAAQEVMERYGGKFPDAYHELLRLKGIGDYTAAAIASISSSESVPVLDGNVIRVMARIGGISGDPGKAATRKRIRELMIELMQGQEAGEFNQAVMEFGALQCTPRSPDCGRCPLSSYCIARLEGRVAELPSQKAAVKTRERHFNYLILSDVANEDQLFLVHREGNDIWKGLYTFPMIETEKPVTWEQLSAQEDFLEMTKDMTLDPPLRVYDIQHVLSHQRLKARFFPVCMQLQPMALLPPGIIRVSPAERDRYPFPRLMGKYLEQSGQSGQWEQSEQWGQ